jgi:hypothetical protein
MKLAKAAHPAAGEISETLEYIGFPSDHWRHIPDQPSAGAHRAGEPPEDPGVGNFPDGNSALMLVVARLGNAAGSRWGTKNYVNTDLLNDLYLQEAIR